MRDYEKQLNTKISLVMLKDHLIGNYIKKNPLVYISIHLCEGIKAKIRIFDRVNSFLY